MRSHPSHTTSSRSTTSLTSSNLEGRGTRSCTQLLRFSRTSSPWPHRTRIRWMEHSTL
jgi:hypothetical protein